MTLAPAPILPIPIPEMEDCCQICARARYRSARAILRALRAAATLLRRERGRSPGYRAHQRIVEARDLAAYLLRMDRGLPWGRIGRLLGGRHHSTAMCAHATVARRLAARDPETCHAVQGVRLLLVREQLRLGVAVTPMAIYWRLAYRRDLWGRRIAM